MKWFEDKSEKKRFEIDHLFYRYFIKTNFISIGERIRIVKYKEEDINLTYSRILGINDKYIFRYGYFYKLVSYFYRILNKFIYLKEEYNGEDSIISSKFIKNSFIKKVCETHFKSYIRDIKLDRLLS